MPDYTFKPLSGVNTLDWSAPFAWVGGAVPNDPAAIVTATGTIDDPYQSTTTLEIAAGETFSVDTLTVTSLDFVLDGELDAAGAVTTDTQGQTSGTVISGTLRAASFTAIGDEITDAPSIQGGTLDLTGDYTGALSATDLHLTCAALAPDQMQVGGESYIDVTTPGGFEGMSGGSLLGTILVADGTLHVGETGPISTLGGTLTLFDGGNILTGATAATAATSISTTLHDITATGDLVLSGQNIWTALTVAGTLQPGSIFDAPSLTIEAGGILDADGSFLYTPIANAGTVLANAVAVAEDDVTGDGTFEITAGVAGYPPNFTAEGGTLEFAAADSNDVVFDLDAGLLILDAPARFTGTIEGFGGTAYVTEPGLGDPVFAPGTGIELSGITTSAITAYSYSGDASAGVLTIEAGGQTIALDFVGNYQKSDFVFTPASAGSTGTIITDAACFAEGTLIETDQGPIPVERLAPGMLAKIADGTCLPIIWVGNRRVHCNTHPAPTRVLPIRVRAGAIDGARPFRDLRLSPDHALLVDGVLVPVGLLVDGTGILRESCDTVVYHHVELSRHEILLAEGAEAESYVDTGNRHQFANAPIVALQPDFAPGPLEAGLCAELVLAGPRLDEIRARRAARALPGPHARRAG